MKDYYDILQVSPNAEPEVIEAAYRRLARKYHPDVYSGADANERMRDLNVAFETLFNASSRAEYDRTRRAQEDPTSNDGEATSEPKAAPSYSAGAPTAGKRRFVVLGAALTALVAFTGVGAWALERDGDSDPLTTGGTPSATAPNISAVPTRSETGIFTVWEPNEDYLSTQCSDSELGLSGLNPFDDAADAQCLAEAMVGSGASSSAVGFFQSTGMFLIDYQETGVVDVGVIAAPWSDMDRQQTVLLNGTSGLLTLSDVIPGAWERDPRYLAVAAQVSGPLLIWPEYSSVLPGPGQPGVNQAFTITYPLRTCRACEDTAVLVSQVSFDGDGQLLGSQLLDPLVAAE